MQLVLFLMPYLTHDAFWEKHPGPIKKATKDQKMPQRNKCFYYFTTNFNETSSCSTLKVTLWNVSYH